MSHPDWWAAEWSGPAIVPRVTSPGRGYPENMISALLDVIRMVVGLVLDIVTLPFRVVLALLGGAEFEFRRFSRTR
jgi:hypothetical protein